MKCAHCKGTIASGAEAQKMIVEYEQPDGTVKIYGYLMPDGPLTAADGVLLRGWHHKCFHVVRKRDARGDAVTGRVITGGFDTSAYVVSQDVADVLGVADRRLHNDLAARVLDLEATARRVGKPIGDPEVTEAFRAQENGGPYEHRHQMPLEVYQLLAHLRYAHGYQADDVLQRGAQSVHATLHAAGQLATTLTERANDPGHADAADRDWREQRGVDL